MDGRPDERKDFRIIDSEIRIESEEQRFLIGRFPSIAITGFIDVEKFLSFEKQNFFLEKKLPFQILIISSDENNHK